MNNQAQQPPAEGASNQQDIQQKQCQIGQATNAPPGTLASYETVVPDEGVVNDAGKYASLLVLSV